MKISLKDGTVEPVVVLDTDEEGECSTCKRETPTLMLEGQKYDSVEVCPDCLIAALTPSLSRTESSAPQSRSGR